jgi:hypothetical protein
VGESSTATAARNHDVFLNIPYDRAFTKLYLAYITGISSLRFRPRAAIEVTTGEGRLDRIIDLMSECAYSVHDLSRVQIDHKPPATPRFNMPFELGLAVALARYGGEEHGWIVLEKQQHRLGKSLSDLRGIDPFIHGGTVQGVLREISNALVRETAQPTVPEMFKVYESLRLTADQIKANLAAKDLFSARAFRDLSFAAATLVDYHIPRLAQG